MQVKAYLVQDPEDAGRALSGDHASRDRRRRDARGPQARVCASGAGKIMTDSAEDFLKNEYAYGFVTPVDSDAAPRGLSEDTIRFISKKKNEPK